MTIRMGYWDCPACGKERIEGPNEACTGCGRPRDQNIQFYTDDNAPPVTDPELVKRARMGADWHCRFCGADNRAGHIECQNCGAGPDGTKSREAKFTPAAGAAPPAPAKKGSGLTVLLVILAIVGAIGGGVWFLFLRTTSLQVTVEEAVWTKTVQLEERQLKKESAWEDEVPKGAKELKRETKSRKKEVQDGTKKVKVGQKDLGNGMFEDVFEEKPNMVKKEVDDTWVTFEIEKWVQGKKLKETSKDGSEPDDPKVKKDDDIRVAERENKLVLKLKGSDGKSYDYDVDMKKGGDASKYKEGKKFTAEVNTMGSVVKLK